MGVVQAGYEVSASPLRMSGDSESAGNRLSEEAEDMKANRPEGKKMIKRVLQTE